MSEAAKTTEIVKIAKGASSAPTDENSASIRHPPPDRPGEEAEYH